MINRYIDRYFFEKNSCLEKYLYYFRNDFSKGFNWTPALLENQNVENKLLGVPIYIKQKSRRKNSYIILSNKNK